MLRSTDSVNTDRKSLRLSEKRRRMLERDSRRRTKESVELEIREDYSTASVQKEGDTFSIVVSGREFEQPVTDYDPRAWDFLAQNMLTLHENAHVLFTDFDDFQERLDTRDECYHGVYKRLHNAFEDGRIENLIRGVYPTYSTQLLHFRANMFSGAYAEDSDPPNDGVCAAPKSDGERCGRTITGDKNTCWQHDEEDAQPWGSASELSVAKAVEIGALDRTAFNSGMYDQLIDPDCDEVVFGSADDREVFMSEIHPRLEETSEEVVSEEDAQRANRIVCEFVDDIIDHIDSADKGGAGEMDGNGAGPGGMPNDTGREGEPAEPSHNINAQQRDIEVDPDEVSKVEDEVEDEIEQKIERQIEMEVNQDEGNEMKAAVKAASGDGNLSQSTVSETPNSGQMDNPSLWEEAKKKARLINRHLDMDPNKRTRSRWNQPRGTADGASLIRAHVGDQRNYKRSLSRPGQPEFNLTLVLDRSGSMRGECRRTAISCVLQTVHALEEHRNVNVLVLELYKGELRRVMPLHGEPEQYKVALTHDDKGGGTPLTDALSLAKERLKQESGPDVENRVFVVTDGVPDNKEKYETELRKSGVPVIGISITDRASAAGEQYYHRHQTVPGDGEGLTRTLGKLMDEMTETDKSIVPS